MRRKTMPRGIVFLVCSYIFIAYSLLQLFRQFHIRVLVVEPAFSKGVLKEEERIAKAVLDQKVPAGRHLRVQLVRVDPAGYPVTDGSHFNFRVLFVLHPVLEDFKLQLADCPQNVVVGLVVAVELDSPFLNQLVHPLVEGLLLHDVLW